MNYPPTTLSANDTLTIAQISDLHLSGQPSCAPSYQKFLHVLALAQRERPNLLLLTGDLVNDGDKRAYDWLFDTLARTNLAFACIAGNHDVTLEHHKHLPFERRTFEPIAADARLLDKHKITITLAQGVWQILLLNSAVGGKIYGQLNADSLTWLQCHLRTQIPTIIAMHHHPTDVASAWIDAHCLQNKAEFWRIINDCPHVKAVLCGHVHQAHQLIAPTQHQCTVYTCPSTDRQFMPHQDSFMLDNQLGGLRILRLNHHAIIAADTKRYDVYPK